MTVQTADVNPEFGESVVTPIRLAGAVTLRDVAKTAGVSVSTASRVLDERLPPSRTAAADRVRKAAADLGYVRDPLASGLRRAGTSTVGVIVPRLTDTVMAILFEEIAGAAAARGLFAVVATTGDRPEAERVAVQSLVRRRVDGIIRTTARLDAPLHLDEATSATKQVLALRSDGVLPAAVGDDQLGGYLATRKLIDLGHRRIGLVSGPEYATSAGRRRDGYVSALEESGIEVDTTIMVGDSFSMEAGERAGHDLFDRPDRPTAVLAAAAARGLRVPDDVSLIGYNDIPVVGRLPVPLTTVRVPFGQIAAGAMQLLLDATDAVAPDGGGAPRTLTYAPTLIPRRS